MDSITTIANRLIRQPIGSKTLNYPKGKTDDIIRMIIDTDKKYRSDTKNFSPYLKGVTDEQTCRNIWSFVKRNIRYQVDPAGYQYVKSPARTWADRVGDCKSFSLFIGSILRDLDIPFIYRFVSFRPGGDFTHVYIVAMPKNDTRFIIDAVIDQFNTEKPYFKKKDVMTKIYQMAGIGAKFTYAEKEKRRKLFKQKLALLSPARRAKVLSNLAKRRKEARNQALKKKLEKMTPRQRATYIRKLRSAKIKSIKGFDIGNVDPSTITDGEMLLYIAKDRLQAEQQAVEQVRGIGSLKVEKYQDSIDMLDDAIDVYHEYKMGAIDSEELESTMGDIAEMAVNGEYSIASSIAGIGKKNRGSGGGAKRQQKKTERKQKISNKRTERKANKSKKKEALKAANKLKGKEKRKAKREARKQYGTKTGKFLRKVAKAGGKALKTVAKAATLPQRMAVKAILEVMLPKAAPFFLYLFINDPALISKLPAKVRRKRQKAEKVSNFIVNVIGMKRTHFMGIVRNGIIKQYGKQPEAVIADQAKGIAGIGAAPLLAALPALVGILKKIAQFFNKKDSDSENISEDDVPAAEDWETSEMDKGDQGGDSGNDYSSDAASVQQQRNQLANEIRNQSNNLSIHDDGGITTGDAARNTVTDSSTDDDSDPDQQSSSDDDFNGDKDETGGRKGTWNSLSN